MSRNYTIKDKEHILLYKSKKAILKVVCDDDLDKIVKIKLVEIE